VKLSRIALLLFAVFAGLYWVPRLLVVDPQARSEYDTYVTARLPQFERALNDALMAEAPACVRDGHLLNTREFAARGPFDAAANVYRPRCDRCDDLAAAGLLNKIVEDSLDRGGNVTTRYELTTLGRSVYSEELRPLQGGAGTYVTWRFCFGTAALHEITEALAPLALGGNMYVGVEYVPRIVDPHPFLFDPKSRPLRLAVPTNTDPALLPPRVTTLAIHPDNSVHMDGSMRYGKFVNR